MFRNPSLSSGWESIAAERVRSKLATSVDREGLICPKLGFRDVASRGGRGGSSGSTTESSASSGITLAEGGAEGLSEGRTGMELGGRDSDVRAMEIGRDGIEVAAEMLAGITSGSCTWALGVLLPLGTTELFLERFLTFAAS
jgi:hypothetical protein